jgi:hypothetical protein
MKDPTPFQVLKDSLKITFIFIISFMAIMWLAKYGEQIDNFLKP